MQREIMRAEIERHTDALVGQLLRGVDGRIRPHHDRRIVTYAAIVVRPDSAVYTAQQLANKSVGVPFYFGTHYLALHLLEGFLPRELIKVCQAPNGSRYRFDSMMKGE